MPKPLTYGSWPSPVGGDAVARDPGWTPSLVIADGADVYWSETRPLEDGREALMRWRDCVLPAGGAEDPVVPPSQSEAIVAALRENGIRHEYLVFEGEEHGFRKAENIARAVEDELAFYRSIFDR